MQNRLIEALLKAIYGILIIGLLTNTSGLAAQTETVRYAPPSSFTLTQNLVEDFGVDNSFGTDDSQQLQIAINRIANKGGGRLIIPKGNYSLREIQLKSNVHLVFDPGVVIRPTQNESSRNYSVFSFGKKAPIENISLVASGKGEMYTVDLTQVTNKNVVVFGLRNIKNFLLSDVMIKDVQTKFSAFTFGLSPYRDDYYSPENGIVRNCQIENADYGYGLVQVQAAKNVLFEQISGRGGVTLRLETGETKMNNLQKGGVHDIVGRHIECRDGNAAVMISPHAMQNGLVTIDGVTAVNCGFGVRIGGAFVSKKYKQDIGLQPGAFDPKSSVSNVTATFGKSAQVKPKHFMYIPKTYQTKQHNAETPITNTFCNPEASKKGQAQFAVSVAAVGYFSARDVECQNTKGKKFVKKGYYSINIDEPSIKAIGFDYQKPIIDLTDDVWSKCRYLD